ncbi:MAG: sterol desaturase family protein [Myxococcota bacterium]|nr:sterol desaturase family protein [Myxococcota bacterium]
MVLSDPIFWLIWVASAALMEWWSMVVHGRVWHRRLWWGHKSHHRPRSGVFELNDIFAVFHAALAIFLIVYGFEAGPGLEYMIAFGFGMTTFGIAYFIVHDGFIHERLPVSFLAKSAYLRRVRNAHRVHHRRDHDGPYGLFLGEWELRRAKRRRLKARRVQDLG